MVKPKKHLGQHFLKDFKLAQKIADLLQSPAEIPVLEIGAGTGVLTQFLLNKKNPLYIIEIDRESIRYLKEHFAIIAKQNRLWEGDFLALDLHSNFSSNIAIIGNFPYNISSQIFFKILENRHQVVEVVCMLQKEVAKRIASPPGSKEYGILSVLLQAYYEIKYHFTVSENVFQPPPKVKSAVIRLQRNSTQTLPCEELLFFEVVKTAFNQRRKTLRNALQQFIRTESFKNQSILQKRAEQLTVSDFVFLTQKIQEQS